MREGGKKEGVGGWWTLTLDLENSRFGVWVWGSRRLLRGFQFHPPSRKDSRMARRRRAFLSDTGTLRLIAGSLEYEYDEYEPFDGLIASPPFTRLV